MLSWLSYAQAIDWQWLAPRLMSVVLIAVFSLYQCRRKFNKSSHEVIGGACDNPNCVRCLNYKTSPDTLFDRWAAFQRQKGLAEGSLERIETSLYLKFDSKTQHERSVTTQSPTVLHVVNLESKPYPTFQGKDDIFQLLESNVEVIFQEYKSVVIAETWNNNTYIDSGRWDTLYLLNQGVQNDRLFSLCPATVKLLESLENLMWDGAFGNVFYSKISHDTLITPHFGPTNARIRLQLPLSLPKHGKSVLIVDGVEYIQQKGKCVIFDDSFEHSASFQCEDCDATTLHSQNRVCLIVDLWHPDLTKVEREAIVNLFPTPGVSADI